MKKSFTLLRVPQREDSEQSEDESSDFIEDSHSDLYPGSNNNTFQSLNKDKKFDIKSSAVIAASDDDEETSSYICNLSHPEESIISHKKKNKKRFVIESDEESTSAIESHVISDDCNNEGANANDKSMNFNESEESNSKDYSSFVIEDICSSTKLVTDDTESNRSRNSSSKDTQIDLTLPLIKPVNSNKSRKTSPKVTQIDLTLQRSKSMNSNKSNINSSHVPQIDLTLPVSNPMNTTLREHRDVAAIELSDSDDSGSDKNLLIVDSDTDTGSTKEKGGREDEKTNVDFTHQLAKMKISPDKPIVSHPKQDNSSSNDYFSRLESLKAEEAKLKIQISEVLKNIETSKVTLKTADLSKLPDKGVRLQLYLKKEEGHLRDLRYQQSTLSNEIIKQQCIASTNMAQPKNKQKMVTLPNEQKMFKLPTTNTDVNSMGKRAMETHRTQQALTMDALRQLHNSLKNCPSEDTSATDPECLLVPLMLHQKQALAWLLWREQGKPSGGILADDMGLGKTLTMIALILKSSEVQKEDSEESDYSNDDSDWIASDSHPKLIPGKTLVVCPASLLEQWSGEIKRRVKKGTLSVVVHHGSNREKKARRLARQDVVITTYNIISRDANQLESPLFQIRWRRIIIDEAHQIRNHKTQMAQGAFQLKAKSRWALTGTPVHNKELDLYALIRFIRCSPFDDLTVWKRWVDNRDAAGMQRLNTITKSLMLRRTKESLKQKGEMTMLTEKTYELIYTTPDEEEQSAYEKLLIFSKNLFAQFLHQRAEKEDALKGIPVTSKPSSYIRNAENVFEGHPELARLHKQLKEIPNIQTHDILVLLLRLRQFCCHPALIKSMLNKEDVSREGVEDEQGLDIDLMDKLARMSLGAEFKKNDNDVEKETSALSEENPLFASTRINSKMRKVLEKLEEILEGEDKVIVVSQWVSLLDLIYGILKEKKIKCVKLTGSVPVKDRGDIVDKFNRKGHGPRVMMLSLTAGGVGLNLVGGNHLLLIDLHWNPQMENQAFDRIYRVGQDKPVYIYKFISTGTIEENIFKLQKEKLAVASDVLTGSKHTSKLSLDDLKMLFQITK